MATKYSIREICEYNKITQRIYDADYSESLPIRDLLDIYESKEKFDIEYVRYVIDKYLYEITSFIYEKTKYNVSLNTMLRHYIQNNNIDRDYCDEMIEYYASKNDDCGDYSTIEEIIKENNIPILYYYYYKEEEEMTQIIRDYLNDFNDRKFFIIR